MKRVFDIIASLGLLAAAAPFIGIGALGICLSSPGPIFYRARRVGRDGAVFTMLKLRTMHQGAGPVITSGQDPRIFAFGSLMRKLKIDELPQFWNVLKGDMSIVGPRPEDPKIVREHYSSWMKETLAIRPGITSMGAVFYYTQAEQTIDDSDPERHYVESVMPAKLAVERAYMDRATFLSDLRCMILTAAAVLAQGLGRPMRLPARDLRGAEKWAPSHPFMPR